ncbi:MAG: hypothetical protein AB1476_05240, partial [Candidatus Hadarchaeota archaeon]
GDIHYWGLMGHQLVPESVILPKFSIINPPPPVMSYNKLSEKAAWLKERYIPSGIWQVKFVEHQRYQDEALKHPVLLGSSDEYLFEARRPADGVMQEDPWAGVNYPLKPDAGLLLYKKERGTEKIFTVPAHAWWWDDHNRVTLVNGEFYSDVNAGVVFRVTNVGTSYVDVEVASYVPSQPLVIYSIAGISVKGPRFSSEAPPTSKSFDVDLHVYTPDGKHVGPRYDNSDYILYDMEIENAYTSRNISGGGPEWIAVPQGLETYAVVDATPAREWAEEMGVSPENVEITAQIQVIRYDENGARLESKTETININPTAPTPFAVPAIVDIDPNTLNLKSKGMWITAYIELPEGHPEDIDTNSVKLNGAVSVESSTSYGFVKDQQLVDRDADGLPELMVKFDRSAVQKLLQPGNVKLTIGGNFVDLLPFEGSGTIKVR